MAPRIIGSPYTPYSFNDDTLSLPQFMTRYNPDQAKPDKIVHTDIISGKSLSYGGLREEAGKCAWGMKQKLGVKEQDVVLAIVPNSTDFVLLAHATWWAGAIFSPVNTAASVKDLTHIIRLVRPQFVVFAPIYLKMLQESLAKADLGVQAAPRLITILEKSSGLPLFPEDIAGRSNDETIPPYDLGGKSAKDVVATMCYSSGTTGLSKGVQISHFNHVANIMQFRTSLPSVMHGGMSEVFFPPYCHVYGLSNVVLQNMWVGNFTCAMHKFELDLFCQKMAQYKATWCHIVPPIALAMSTSDAPLKYDLSSLKTIVVSAAPLKEALQQRLKARFGQHVRVVQGFGMSECSPVVAHQSPEHDHVVGTVGKLISGTEGRLVDPGTLQDVAPGEEGELWLRGPQIMMGYIRNEQATRESFSSDGKWLRTGDILREDSDGNLWITDRLKEFIKYKGFQVSPSELEDLLLHHPSVTDAAVTSIYSDADVSELPIAYVSLRADLGDAGPAETRQALEDIRTWADGQVAGYKKLRGGVFQLQQLPKTPSGKILRRELPCKKAVVRPSKM